MERCETCVEEEDEGGGNDEWNVRAVVGLHV